MRLQKTEQIGRTLQWAHLPVFMLVASLVGFVRLHFGTGRMWVGGAACVTQLLSLVINFAWPSNLPFREVTAARRIEFLGEMVSEPQALANPWTWLGELSSILLLAFVVHTSLGLWRRRRSGDGWRATTVGGSVSLFILLAAGVSALFHARVLQTPYLATLPFLAVIVAIGSDLGYDMLRAAEITQRLQASETALRESEVRFRTLADTAPVMIWMSGTE